jgi:acetamidase/formamidase
MPQHHLHASPETIRWGVFDAAIPPVLTVKSGDTVVIDTVSGKAGELPKAGSGLTVPPALLDIIAANPPRLGPHILTGPVAIHGAEPGDTLEVRIDAIDFGADYGYCAVRPLSGTIPEDFPVSDIDLIPIDRERRTCRLPWGTDLPLAPFFGVMGVAPPPVYGAISTVQPRQHGGNMDNKDLGAGSTLYLPVFTAGANFSCGDGHGVQGHGEVCVNALETSLIGRFTFVVHKNTGLAYPRGETATHWISMGLHADLDEALKRALREMIAFITARANISAVQAYKLCSLAVDFHVTQSVNGEKGVHGMLAKSLVP